jgi:hypothetical protein
MISFLISFLICLGALVRSRYNLGLEILALRQQLGILKRKIPRPQLQLQDRIFWILTPPSMARMARRLGYCQTRNRCRLASGWLSVVLAPSIAAQQEPGQAKDRCRGANSHPANGERESLLGRSQNSR